MGSPSGKSTATRSLCRRSHWTKPNNVHLHLNVYSVPGLRGMQSLGPGSVQKELSMDTPSPQGELSAGHPNGVRWGHTMVRFLLSQHPWSPLHRLLSNPETSSPGMPFPLQPSPVDTTLSHVPHIPVRARKTPCSFPITTAICCSSRLR